MWNEPYLETCCRSALHRLMICGAIGRPKHYKDQPCLDRLCDMGFAAHTAAGRIIATDAGQSRHASEILKKR